MDAYLWVDRPRAGAENMAIDEAMAAWSASRGAACLRFYRWSTPTLSLGYFQPADQRLDDPLLASLPFTRRLSGGGAIVHDRELTYSLAVPQAGFSKSAAEPLYRSGHAAIRAALQAAGYEPRMHEDWAAEHPTAAMQRGEPEPFLCFERRSPVDLVIGDAKVVGSAQRRLTGVLLQHGSVLLARSDAAPGLPGLAELPRQAVSPVGRRAGLQQDRPSGEGLMERIIAEFWESFIRSVKPDGSVGSMQTDGVAEMESMAAELAEGKYSHPNWTRRR